MMDTLFHKQIAFSDNYPAPIYPMAPHTSYIKLRAVNCESAFLVDGVFYSYGRYAILKALQLIELDNDCAVLMPAYHCRSMVEPAIHLGVRVMFYPVNDKLEPEMDEIRSIIEEPENAIKAIFVVHYFGFKQNFENISNLCIQHNVKIIEDCAHAFYDLSVNKKMGALGDIAIASPRKFFPVDDGGVLLDNRPKVNVAKLRRAKLKQEFKSIVHIIKNHMLGVLIPLKTRANRNKIKNISIEVIPPPDEKPDERDGFSYINPSMMESQGLLSSRWFIKHASHRKICERRRNNYAVLLEKLEGLSACKPLFPQLPDNVVPYVFPLILSKLPMSAFHALKKSGTPMLRWENIAVTDCAISGIYRTSLIQLPCHQDLSEKQMGEIASIVKIILNKIWKM